MVSGLEFLVQSLSHRGGEVFFKTELHKMSSQANKNKTPHTIEPDRTKPEDLLVWLKLTTQTTRRKGDTGENTWGWQRDTGETRWPKKARKHEQEANTCEEEPIKIKQEAQAQSTVIILVMLLFHQSFVPWIHCEHSNINLQLSGHRQPGGSMSPPSKKVVEVDPWAWGLSEWRLTVFSESDLVSSQCTGFLPQCKDEQIMQSDNSKLPIGVSANDCLCGPVNNRRLVQSVTLHLPEGAAKGSNGPCKPDCKRICDRKTKTLLTWSGNCYTFKNQGTLVSLECVTVLLARYKQGRRGSHSVYTESDPV